MTKRVEFHQATLTVLVRIVDDERSYGLNRFQLDLLINTDTEWQVARESVGGQLEDLQRQLSGVTNADGG